MIEVPSQLVTGGPWVLVSVFFLLVFTGQLVPGREMRYWRQAFFELQKQMRDLSATGKATRDVLRALPEAPPEEGPDP